MTIGNHSLIDTIVSVSPEQNLQDVFEGRPNDAFYIERVIRLVSERTQCCQAACGNAGLRINQGTVEIQ